MVADALAASTRPQCQCTDLATVACTTQYCDPYSAVRLSSVAIDTPPLYGRGASSLLVPEHGALALQPQSSARTLTQLQRARCGLVRIVRVRYRDREGPHTTDITAMWAGGTMQK